LPAILSFGRRIVKQRIAVLALFSFFVSIAAAPLAWGKWPLWPKKGESANKADPAPAPDGDIRYFHIDDARFDRDDLAEEAAALPAEAAADASEAGETGGEKVADGFFTGNKGKLAAFGAAVVAVAVIAAGGGSSTAHH
jgi:hypothetical protein